MIVVMMVFMVVMVMILMMRLVRHLFEHLLHQIAAALHRLKQLHTGQFLPRRGHNARMRVQPTQQAYDLV